MRARDPAVVGRAGAARREARASQRRMGPLQRTFKRHRPSTTRCRSMLGAVHDAVVGRRQGVCGKHVWSEAAERSGVH